MSKRFDKDPYDPDQLRISMMAVAGGTYEFYVNGMKHMLGPIRLGPQWFQIGGREVCVNGISEEDLDQARCRGQ